MVPPRRKCITAIFRFPDLRTAFLQDLARIPFFYEMDEEQRAKWLLDHATDTENELADIGDPDPESTSESDGSVDEKSDEKLGDGESSVDEKLEDGKSDKKKTAAKQVRVEIHDLGRSNLVTNVAPDVLSQLVVHGTSWTARYIRDQFPKAANSKARHHTLFLLPGILFSWLFLFPWPFLGLCLSCNFVCVCLVINFMYVTQLFGASRRRLKNAPKSPRPTRSRYCI
jgi:hypothetical protein